MIALSCLDPVLLPMSRTPSATRTPPVHLRYEVVVGMEVHAQLATRSKMFCGCHAEYQGFAPNSHVCPVCLGLPGAMPVINRAAVAATVATGLALNCTVAELAVFARKNYTYPDLPKGYQITQFEFPLCHDGSVDIDVPGQGRKTIGIRRAHLEEDTGKSTHAGAHSLVDLNRAGVPLMEIVTEADIGSAEEAYLFLVRLRTILRYLGVNSGDMEKGALRCEPNISVRTPEQAARGELGTKVEVKNLNSLRAVQAAIEYEHRRQARQLARGQVIEQVNMGWDEGRQCTVLQRSKESSEDYRYFPEPDLPPLQIDRDWVARIQASLPEMVWTKQERYREAWGVRAQEAALLASEHQVATYFEEAVARYGTDQGKPQTLALWITTELFSLLYRQGEGQDPRLIAGIRVQPGQLAALLQALDRQVINNNTAKQVLATMFATGEDARTIIEREGLAMVSDTAVLDDTIQAILDANPVERERYRAGETKLLGFFMGQVMQQTRGKADPHATRTRLQEMLAV